MGTLLFLAGVALLSLGALGWLTSLAPSTAGRLRILLELLLVALGGATAVQGFGVGGVGTLLPGWEFAGQAAKALLYGMTTLALLALYMSPTRIAWAQWRGLIIYSLALLLAGSQGTVPGMSENYLTPLALALIGGVAVHYIPRFRLIGVIRCVLVALCVGSLMYWVIAPDAATSDPDSYYINGYTDSVIGLSQRLHGLTGHGNTLGYIAGAALLLGLYRPAQFRWEWLWQGLVLVCLIAAQSKTMWVAVAVAWAAGAFIRMEGLSITQRRFSQAILLAILGIGFVAVNIYAPFLERFDSTLTGRTNVWQITFQEFLRNPLGGYGPTLWNEPYRTAANMPWVGQAHNQMVQTLGQSGIIGIIGLLVMLVMLAVAAWRSRYITGGTSLALFMLLILRGVSETPLRVTPDISFVIVFAVYLLATAYSGDNVGQEFDTLGEEANKLW